MKHGKYCETCAIIETFGPCVKYAKNVKYSEIIQDTFCKIKKEICICHNLSDIYMEYFVLYSVIYFA